jgi:hypothetical protein
MEGPRIAGLESALPQVPPPPPPPPPPPSASTFGCTTAGTKLEFISGDGTFFQLRTGPNYKKNGKKTNSLTHIYQPVTMDLHKRQSICFHTAQHLTLPPPPDKDASNESGLPRRLIINIVIPQGEPSMNPLAKAVLDGPCFQVVTVYTATGASLKEWRDEGSNAAKLFTRFIENAPSGVLPSSGDIDVKERLKIIPWIENVKTVGLPSWLEGYNGKPALITKSGSITRGDDYIEITMNLFRFGFLTRKGMHHLLPGVGGFELHCALTIEGREDDELDERCFIACKARNLDLIGLAKEGVLPS